MAKENVKAFFEALSKDEAIQQALKQRSFRTQVPRKIETLL